MTRSHAILIAVLSLGLASAVNAEESVKGFAVSDQQAAWAASLGADVRQSVSGTRKVEITATFKGKSVVARGAEVGLIYPEDAKLFVQRLKFRTPEDAAFFYEEAIREQKKLGGNWAMDLAGQWVVRARGDAAALERPGAFESVLDAAWAHGPEAGDREARMLSVLGGKGYVFEDAGHSQAVDAIFKRYMADARARSDKGELGTGETLTPTGYRSRVGTQHVMLSTTAKGVRQGWIAPEETAAEVAGYSRQLLTMHRKKKGMLGTLFENMPRVRVF